MKIKIPQLKKFSYIIIIIILFSLFLSFLFWTVNFPGIRRIFIYQSTDSDSYSMEYRYLSLFPENGKIRNYVDELLLGPISEHCKPIFVLGTKVVSCFERDSLLYLDLSASIFNDVDKKVNFEKQIKLLKRNILKNFKNIKDIEIFIDGEPVFEYIY